MDEEQEIKEIEEVKLKGEIRQKQTCKKQDAYFWFKSGVMGQRFAEEGNLSPKQILRDFNFKWKNIMG